MIVDPLLFGDAVRNDRYAERNLTKSNPSSENFEGLSFESPLEHFRFCFSLLIQAKSLGASTKVANGYELASAHLIAKNYQPSMAALSLVAYILKLKRLPISFKLFHSSAIIGDVSGLWPADRLIPIPISLLVTDLWEEIGKLDQNQELIHVANSAREWLKSIGLNSGLIFYRENAFIEDEMIHCVYSNDSCGLDSFLTMARISAQSLSFCFTLSGWNTGLGTFKMGGVEIRAFGPQRYPLSDSSQFGIAQISAHRATVEADLKQLFITGWTRCYAAKEIWLLMQAKANQEGADIDVHWTGIEPSSSKWALVFYIKAKSCVLEDGSPISPQSLQHYQGKAQKIIFDQTVQLDCSEALNLQIIPLAGFGCFWNATFLISFEITSSQNQASYLFRFL